MINFELQFLQEKSEQEEAGSVNSKKMKAIEEVNEDAVEEPLPEIPEMKLTSQEMDVIHSRREIKWYLKEAREKAPQDSKLRNFSASNLDHVLKVKDIAGSWEKVKDNFFKHLADLSLLKKEYKVWMQSIVSRPLLTPKVVPQVVEEVKEDPKDKKKKEDPKATGKDKKKEAEEVKEVEVPKVEEPKEMAYLEGARLLEAMKKKLKVNLESWKTTNVLDIFADLLDKHKQDFQSGLHLTKKTKEEENHQQKQEIDSFLDDLFCQVNSGKVAPQASCRIFFDSDTEQSAVEEGVPFIDQGSTSSDPHQVYSIHDNIGLGKKGNGTWNKASLELLERNTFKELKVPGIDRHLMPVLPEYSERKRNYLFGQINSFFDQTEPELKRRLLLHDFEEVLSREASGRTWSFFNRVSRF